jgi:hypothetical protein
MRPLNYGRCFIKGLVDESDRYLQPLPMFYTAGTGITYSMLQAGGSLAYPKGFSSKTFWDDIRRFDATITIAIHGMVSFLLDQPPRPDDAENPLRVVYMGPLTRHREFAERFGCRVYTAYGMTEVPVPLVSGLDPEDSRSCGRNADPEHYELRLVDENDVPVPVGTPGELVVRHSLPWTINSGYKNMPEATANAWRNGWFHTGDEFTLDEEGNYYFLDRMKDVIRSAASTSPPYEVEEECARTRTSRTSPRSRSRTPTWRSPPATRSEGRRRPRGWRLARARGAVEYLTPRMPRHWLPRFVEMAPSCRERVVQVRKSDIREAGVTAATWDREKRPRSAGGADGRSARSGPLDETRSATARGRELRWLRSRDLPLAPPARLRRRGSGSCRAEARSTWTTQGFEPKAPYVQEPGVRSYAVGYVELPSARVEGLLAAIAPPDRPGDGGRGRRTRRPAHVRVRPRQGRSVTEIAVVGAGIHPFGRHEGVSGLAMGVHAVRAALHDAGVAWGDVQVAYGGSEDAGNADTMVADLGPTGLPFVNAERLRHRRLVARRGPPRTRVRGSRGRARRWVRQASAWGVPNDPADWPPDWYGRSG